MAALTSARVASPRSKFVRRVKRPLAAGVKAIQGAAAMIILSGTGKGYYAPADDARVGRVVGQFLETVDNTDGLIGAQEALIDFGYDRELLPYVNDSGSPLDATDREGLAYVLDDQTATGTVSSALYGRLYEVDANNIVWVELMAGAPAGSATVVAPEDPSSAAASAGASDELARADHLHHIPLATPTAEGLMSAAYASAIHAPVANLTALAAIAAADRSAGMLCLVLSDVAGEVSLWRFHATSTAADTSENLVKAPAAGTGRWLRADKRLALYLPFTFATADGATLFTTPVGARIKPVEAWWDVTTSFTGGTDSAIGVYTSVTGWDTPGDILGGTGGDVAATLVSTDTRQVGTVGAKLDTLTDARLILIAADTIHLDRTVSAFTAGVGRVRVLCDLLANAGA